MSDNDTDDNGNDEQDEKHPVPRPDDEQDGEHPVPRPDSEE